MRRACKKDINHDEIAAVFIYAGWDVIDTSSCHGVLLDFIAQKTRSGVAWFVEVKNGRYGKLTDNEAKFFMAHPERSVLIRSVKDAIDFINNFKNY